MLTASFKDLELLGEDNWNTLVGILEVANATHTEEVYSTHARGFFRIVGLVVRYDRRTEMTKYARRRASEPSDWQHILYSCKRHGFELISQK